MFELFRSDMRAAGLAGVKTGDYLVVEGAGWTVTEVSGALNDGVFNLMCKKRV